MKILVSAYACHPKTGSESRLGWQWALQLAKRGHEVWVLTRGIAKPDIDEHLAREGKPRNLHFIYHDCIFLLPILRLLKAGFRYFYYYIWQWGAYRVAAQAHATNGFDLVHHATWVQFRTPSFMGRLGIPFILGPIGGGEAAPWRLRTALGPRQWFIDLLRDVWTKVSQLDPNVRLTYRQATRINVTTPETMARIPRWAKAKANLRLAIAFERPDNTQIEPQVNNTGQGLRLIFVGRYLGLKGMSIGLPAFSRLLQVCPEATLTMLGDGPAGPGWKRLATRLGIQNRVRWLDWLPHEEVQKLYASHDVLLFPSLHDSGGLVLLEAMSSGLPVVCLALGGPGCIIDESCGIKVSASGRSRREIEMDLADAMVHLAQNPGFLGNLRRGAIQRSGMYGWDQLVISTLGGAPGQSQLSSS